MKRKKRFYQGSLLFAAAIAAVGVSGCSSQKAGAVASEVETGEENQQNTTDPDMQGAVDEKAGADGKPFYAGMAMSQTPDVSQLLQGSLDLKDFQDKWVYYDEYGCYGLEYIVYCENPADPIKECMNIYVPAAYMNAGGTINEKGTVNGYTAATAPIIYQNGVGGYAEADASKISDRNSNYIKQGYIFVSPASRGKETQSADGTYIGKSPAGLVDLKAGIRFLKANDAEMAGDANKIISIGTSAGGAMSALLGSTGNVSDYDPYLKEIGAAMDQTDDVYAAQAYCPITDLDHADQAYEWMYQNLQTYNNSRSGENGESTDFEKAVSAQMSSGYVDYINSLKLVDPESGEALNLGEDGRSGSFYNYMVAKVEDAATVYLEKISEGSLNVPYTLEDYLKGNYTKQGRGGKAGAGQPGDAGKTRDAGQMADAEKAGATGQPENARKLGEGQKQKKTGKPENAGKTENAGRIKSETDSTETKDTGRAVVTEKGTDLSSFLSWDGKQAKITSLDDYLADYNPRMKTVMAFDNLEMSENSGENLEFGDETHQYFHFDSYMPDVLESLKEEFPDEYAKYAEGYDAVIGDKALAERKQLLNPLNYIGSEDADTAEHIRIRVGTQDADTALSISAVLALSLENKTGADVDYALVWDQPHGDADYDGELVQWIEKICK
ncbi:hypothetical protein [Clostridium sp. AM42-4]|uniref:hypothetical protein n=1 Tax=Clostridium sp. AM42-4 TaxID=2292305 RepID=UPI000E4AB2D0|nr:hypothetical protein [Clostridium sp. AM42-4]RHS84622.1 hypothetical protein DW922_12955 [Clostridium sp. AM42-4]